METQKSQQSDTDAVIPNFVGDDFMQNVIALLMVENGMQDKPPVVQQTFFDQVATGLSKRIATFILEKTPTENLPAVVELAGQEMPYAEREARMTELVPDFKSGIADVLESYRTYVREQLK